MDTVFKVQGIMSLIDMISSPLRSIDAKMKGTESNAGRLSQKMSILSKNMGAIVPVAIAIMAAFGAGVGTAADFEAAISQVGAVSQASKNEIAALENSALDLGAKTAFSAVQVAEGQKFLAMAGFNTNKIISAMPAVLDLASASQTGLGRSADIASGIMASFGLKASQMKNAGDVLTRTFTSSKTSLESLGATISNVGSVAFAAGAELHEVAAMAGKLGDKNIDATVAGTALKIMFQRLQGPTTQAATQLRKLGIVTKDSSGNMLPIFDILRKLEISTKKMGSADRAAALKKIFGEEAIGSVTALMKTGIDNIIKYSDILKNGTVTASQVASQQLDNLKGALTILGSAWEGLKISIGKVFLPVLTPLVKGITKVIEVLNVIAKNPIGQWFIGMAAFISVTVIAITVFSGAWAVLTYALPLGIALLGGAGIAFNSIIWPITLVVGCLYALYIAFKNNLFGISDITIGAFNKIKGVFQSIASFFNKIKLVFQAVFSIFSNLNRGKSQISESLGKKIEANGLVNVVMKISGILYKLKNAFNDTVSFIKSINLYDAGVKILSTLVDGIKTTLQKPADLIKSGFEKVRNLLPFSDAKEGPLSKLTFSGSQIMNTLAQGVNKSTALNNAIQKAFTDVNNTIDVPIVASMLNSNIPQTIGFDNTYMDMNKLDALDIPASISISLDNTFNENIPIPRFSMEEQSSDKNKYSASNTNIYISNLNLPEIQDSNDFINSLKEIAMGYHV